MPSDPETRVTATIVNQVDGDFTPSIAVSSLHFKFAPLFKDYSLGANILYLLLR